MTKRPTLTERLDALAERLQYLESMQPRCQLIDDLYAPGFGTCHRTYDEPGHACAFDRLLDSVARSSAENEDAGWHECDVDSLEFAVLREEVDELIRRLDGDPDDPLDRLDALEYELRSEIHDLDEQSPGAEYLDGLVRRIEALEDDDDDDETPARHREEHAMHPITVELDAAEALADQLTADARKAMRRARRLGASYVVGDETFSGYRLRVERVVDAGGHWECGDDETEEAAAWVEQLLGWRRQILAAAEISSMTDGQCG